MNLIEIAYPEGSLDEDSRHAIAARISAGLLIEGIAPEATMRRARRMTHIRFNPASTWVTGDGPVPADASPPLVVTITVPEAWRAEMSAHGIDVIRAALADHDELTGTPSRDDGEMWINVVGIDDGSIGLDGSPATADDVVLRMTEEYRATAATEQLPDGVALDPICGMHVHLGADAVTIEHEGRLVAFCATGCRRAYAREHDLVAP